MIEPRTGLDMGDMGMVGIRFPDRHRRTPADVVDEEARPRRNRLQPEKRHHQVVEGDALADPLDPEDHMRDPVDLDPLTRLAGRHRGAA
jgi:hypothetical protein